MRVAVIGCGAVGSLFAANLGTLDDVDLNRRTQEAHKDLMRNKAYRGRTVVLCWEHKHIANAAQP